MKKFLSFIIYIYASSYISLAQAVDTGSSLITSTTQDVWGIDFAQKNQDVIPLDEEITWEVYIPTSYDPGKPTGVLIYISPQNIINVPSSWMSIMEERNIIWIASRMSGNKVFTAKRILYALTSLEILQKRYQIDPARIYITGFSGGGRVASIAASQYPNIFKGAAYICGANFWENLSAEQLEQVHQNRYVFISGAQDFNLNETKQVYSKYKKAGAKNIKLMVVSRMGHSNPKKQKFAQAIRFLDE